jgi:hypothetical protein
MIVSVGLSPSPRKGDLHRQSPARAGALFTQGERSGRRAPAFALATEVARP